MSVTTPLLVDSPVQVPGRFGLFSVAEIVNEPDVHWQNGVEYFANPAAEVVAPLTVDCSTQAADSWSEGMPTIVDEPFRIRTGFTCKHPGLTAAEISAYARGKLAAAEGPSVESAIWASTESPIMTDTMDTPAGTDAVSITDAVGALDEWLWETYGGTGVLHVARAAIPALRRVRAISVESGKLVIRGSRFAMGCHRLGYGHCVDSCGSRRHTGRHS
ncbi:MAG: hypothetical protein QM673_09845 [Gordonia sp. (in: high G+C Gram-positive bacteria)]